jgi:predicted SAM-dependent methyltransferase
MPLRIRGLSAMGCPCETRTSTCDGSRKKGKHDDSVESQAALQEIWMAETKKDALKDLAIRGIVFPLLTACTRRPIAGVLRERTRRLIGVDLIRMKARPSRPCAIPTSKKLHFGCGDRKVAGWLNVDLAAGDVSIDLAAGTLPWKDHVFEVAVGQMVISQLDIDRELILFLKELRRTLKQNGVLWVSTPDIEKICRSYLENRCADLVADRQTRFPYSLRGRPSAQFVSDLFYEFGDMNHFDFDLLKWCLEKAGFSQVARYNERVLLEEHPDFPPRRDDALALYVRCVA